METTTERDNLRYKKIPLTNGSGMMPALGFGTLIPDPIDTKKATTLALEAGFRLFDSSERYRNEKEVGEAMQEVLKEGKIKREDVFIATKLWNNNHRPERVKPAFEASLKRLQLDTWRALESLVDEGRCKAIGLSDVNVESPRFQKTQ